MKKRIMALFLAMAMVVTATACGKGYKVGDKGEVYNKFIKIKKWKELEVEKIEPPAVTEEEIDSAIITDLQSEWKKVGIKDRAAVDGDTVIINYEGKIDGVPFAGGTAKNAPLKLGSKTLIEGFESGIVGYVPGDTFDLNLRFPENYHKTELAGKAVVFTVTLNAIQPEYSEALVPKLSAKATTTEEYRAEKKAEIEKSNQEAAEEQMRTTLFSLLSQQWEVIEYPKKELEKHEKEAKEYCEAEYQGYLSYVASMSGMSAEEVESSYGMTLDQYVSTMYGTTVEEMAKMQHALQMAMDLIAKVEKIKVDRKDIDAFLKKQAEQEGFEIDEYKELLEEESEEEDLDEILRKATFQEKIQDFLWENCKIVEPKQTEIESETGAETESGDETESSETVTE